MTITATVAIACALLLRLGSAAPPRAPARGGIKLSSCPRGGSSPAAAHDDSEAGIETFARDYEITTSYENGSTCAAQAGENGLDGAFPRRALASTDAATKSWLQLYKSSGAVYADAFDSETIKGAATAERDAHVIIQVALKEVQVELLMREAESAEPAASPGAGRVVEVAQQDPRSIEVGESRRDHLRLRGRRQRAHPRAHAQIPDAYFSRQHVD